MSDPALVREILSQMLVAVERVERRASKIEKPHDFVDSDAGLDMLDAISMMLIALGESCKNLDKITEGTLLASYPAVDWKGVKGMRDIISHHYFDINAENVFSVCRKHMPTLKLALTSMFRDLT